MNVVLGIAAYLVISMVLATLVTGCASFEPGSPEARALIIEKQEEKKAETVEQTLEIIPDWFSELPTSDAAIYTVGTGVSPNLQLSVDKGMLNAKRSLADRLKGLMSSKSKLFVAEQGQGDATIATTEAEQVTTNLIAEVNVSGYSVKESLIHPEGPRYRSFVLLEYPVGKLNRIQLDTLRKPQDDEREQRADDAHKELERDVEAQQL